MNGIAVPLILGATASSTPRYVCLSDLHLGAGYSTLTSTDAQGQPDPSQPSATLVALGQALRQLLGTLGDGPPPTLILLGDVLDMGLSPMGSVAAAFQCFVETVMLDGERPLFAPRVAQPDQRLPGALRRWLISQFTPRV